MILAALSLTNDSSDEIEKKITAYNPTQLYPRVAIRVVNKFSRYTAETGCRCKYNNSLSSMIEWMTVVRKRTVGDSD